MRTTLSRDALFKSDGFYERIHRRHAVHRTDGFMYFCYSGKKERPPAEIRQKKYRRLTSQSRARKLHSLHSLCVPLVMRDEHKQPALAKRPGEAQHVRVRLLVQRAEGLIQQ